MAKQKKLRLVYEDDDIVVVEKPRGLAVQGGVHVKLTLIHELERQLKRTVFPIHRLDKETAGLVLFALNKEAARHYSKLMNDNTIKKEYYALCFDAPPQKEGDIRLPILNRGKKQRAHTEYRVIEKNDDFSLLHIKLHTGRMHQIRIHLAQSTCPIIADDKYGDFKKNKALHKSRRIKHLQLCAFRMHIPIEGQMLSLEMQLPEHMESARRVLFAE